MGALSENDIIIGKIEADPEPERFMAEVMEREVEDFIKKLSDIDLLEYTHTKIHLPEAVEFAKVEFAKRKLSQEKITVLNEELHARIKAREEQIREIASEPLGGKWRIAVFLGGLYFAIPLLFFVPALLKFREKGSEQKCQDMYIFSAAGFILAVILVILRIPPWSLIRRLF